MKSASRNRRALLDQIHTSTSQFDVVIIGGGITGAGIAREAAASGIRTLLVEQRDFAWGTSSRSSKMVHGGLRYLGSGQFGLTRDAVRERQRLMSEAPGLIDPLRFIMPHYRRQFPGPRLFQLLLLIYDKLAGLRSRQCLTPTETLQWVPGLTQNNLAAASAFTDAVTDDARLVQRLLEEAQADGAVCLNYVAAQSVLRSADTGDVTGVALCDTSGADGQQGDDAPFQISAPLVVNAPLVINATGAWAKNLQQQAEDHHDIRPLRGSHLILPFEKLPVSCSVSLLHPTDKRPVFAFPWQGTTVLGTTDLDHQTPLDQEPAITGPEVDYLLEIAATLFPGTAVKRPDVLATWAGVRPVVSSPRRVSNALAKPSKVSREHHIWSDKGLISVAGGKLTTFRLIARQVLEKGIDRLPLSSLRSASERVFSATPSLERPAGIRHKSWKRLAGYYGPELPQVLAAGSHDVIPGTDILWAELAWAASESQVVHLDDLLLRRTRLGLVLAEGGTKLLPDIRDLCMASLGWSDKQWVAEEGRYIEIWRGHYSLPGSSVAASAETSK